MWTYVCFVLRTSSIFVLALCSTPSQTSLNRICRFIDHYPNHLEIELFTALNFFAGAVKNLRGSISIRVSGSNLVIVISPTEQYLYE